MAIVQRKHRTAASRRGVPLGAALVTVTALAAGCGSAASSGGGSTAPPEGPFKSLEVAANAPASFTQPRAGVPLADGSVAFLANVEGLAEQDTARDGERIGVFLLPPGGGAAAVLYAGNALVNPLDLDASLDGKTLYIADPSSGVEGAGAILALPVQGGEPTELTSGFAPRSVTVASDDSVYFSGVGQESGEPGVFRAVNGAVEIVHEGAPLVDPSGIALLKDGGVLVADTRLFDGRREGALEGLGSEAGVVLLRDHAATIFATGFATGYPAGIAVIANEKSLVVSAEAADRSDVVYVFDVADPKAAPLIVEAEFSRYQDSSAGLKCAHDSDTCIWASLSANGGTVYKIRGN